MARILLRITIPLIALIQCATLPKPALACPDRDLDFTDGVKRAASAIEAGHHHRVVVTDFISPNWQISVLGRDLADEFSAALTAADGNLELRIRNGSVAASWQSSPTAIGSNDDLSSDESLESGAAAMLAQMTGAEAVVVGHVNVESASVELTLEVWGIQTRPPSPFPLRTVASSLDKFKMRMRIIPEQEALSKQILQVHPKADFKLTVGLEKKSQDPLKTLARRPTCLDCVASWQNQGRVEMSFVIDPQGGVRLAEVVSAPNHKLAKQALQASRNWHFTPGLDGDGQPTEMNLTVILGDGNPRGGDHD